MFRNIAPIKLFLYVDAQIFVYRSAQLLPTISSGFGCARLPWQLSDQPKCKKNAFLILYVIYIVLSMPPYTPVKLLFKSNIALVVSNKDSRMQA